MKSNKSQTTMYIVLAVGVLAIILTIMYIQNPYTEKTKKLKADNDTLQVRVDTIKYYYDHKDEYQTNIDKMTKDIKATLDAFPAEARVEDVLKLAIDTQATEEAAMIAYTTIGVDERQQMDAITVEDVKRANIEGLEQPLSFSRRVVEYYNLTSYEFIKKIFEIIEKNPNDIAITKVEYKWDDTKELMDGMIQVTFYTAEGTGKEYVPVNFKEFPVSEGGFMELFGKLTTAGQ